MPDRFDLYTPIHKALRAALMQTLQELGCSDFRLQADRESALQTLQCLLRVLRDHIGHEDEVLHPMLEARRPGASLQASQAHDEQLEAVAALEREMERLRAAPTERQPELGSRLYRQLSSFAAESFRLMLTEEREHHALLWQLCSETELAALHARRRLDPASLRWYAQGLSLPELVRLLQGLGTEGLDATLAALSPWLSAARGGELRRQLGLAPVPGLVSV